MPQLPSIEISDELFALFEKWRAKQRPIPSKSEAIRTLLERGLRQEVKNKNE